MPAKSKRSTCFGSGPRLFTNGSAFGSRLTKIRLNHCSARTGVSAKPSGEKSDWPSNSGALISEPSSP